MVSATHHANYRRTSSPLAALPLAVDVVVALGAGQLMTLLATRSDDDDGRSAPAKHLARPMLVGSALLPLALLPHRSDSGQECYAPPPAISRVGSGKWSQTRIPTTVMVQIRSK